MKGMVYGGVIDEVIDRNYGCLLRENGVIGYGFVI